MRSNQAALEAVLRVHSLYIHTRYIHGEAAGDDEAAGRPPRLKRRFGRAIELIMCADDIIGIYAPHIPTRSLCYCMLYTTSTAALLDSTYDVHYYVSPLVICLFFTTI